jgi:coiled-coil domain-containing protein 55
LKMSLKFGLNVNAKKTARVKKTIYDDEPDEEDEDAGEAQEAVVETISSFSTNGPPRKAGLNVPSRSKPSIALPKRKLKPLLDEDEDSRQDASSMAAAQAQVKKAEAIDASIFDYDSFHDAKSTVSEAKKEAAKQDAIERKPKYINNLLDAAARRKQDQQIAKEKLLQRERENEGEEFADKEKFVTSAYKAQQEETRKLEAEEKLRLEQEEARRKKLGGGMQGFYRNMMDQSEKLHQDGIDAAVKLEKEGGIKNVNEAKKHSDAELAAELKAKGLTIHLNEDGQITDKRELLTAGLNVAPSGRPNDTRGADHLRTGAGQKQSAFQRKDVTSQQAQRERQTKMMEEQLEASIKRKREEDEEQKAREGREAKSKKTDTDVSDAKARYLARKAAKEKEAAGG